MCPASCLALSCNFHSSMAMPCSFFWSRRPEKLRNNVGLHSTSVAGPRLEQCPVRWFRLPLAVLQGTGARPQAQTRLGLGSSRSTQLRPFEFCKIPSPGLLLPANHRALGITEGGALTRSAASSVSNMRMGWDRQRSHPIGIRLESDASQ